MRSMRSSLSCIHPSADIAKSVEIGPFSYVEKDVVIDEGTYIAPNVIIMRGSRIGKNCKILPGSIIGGTPKDSKFKGENTLVIIGDNTTIGENVTINRGTASTGKTVVGSNCQLMTYVDVAHDCKLGNNIIISDYTKLEGEVIIDDYSVLSRVSLVNSSVHIGSHVMIQGGCKINIDKDVPPFIKAKNEPLSYVGVNSVGLYCCGYSSEQIDMIQNIYHSVYMSGMDISQAITYIEDEFPHTKERDEILSFINNSSSGIIKEYFVNNNLSVK